MTAAFEPWPRLHSPGRPVASPAISSQTSSPPLLATPLSSPPPHFKQRTPSAEPCSGCADECSDLGCSESQITPQCTNQCVVVSCTDTAPGCPSEPAVQICADDGCEVPNDCVDCGLEDFLDCCTQFHHQEPQDSKNYISSQSWEEAYLEAFLCACGEITYTIPDEPRSSMYGDLRSEPDISSQYSITTHNEVVTPSGSDFQHAQIPTMDNDVGMHVTQYPRPVYDAQSQSIAVDSLSPFVTCLWGNCQAQFRSLPDLVAHVNLTHLQAPAATQADAVSCLWRDCTQPNTLPGPSSGNQSHHVLGALTNHLFHDHLGLCVSALHSEREEQESGGNSAIGDSSVAEKDTTLTPSCSPHMVPETADGASRVSPPTATAVTMATPMQDLEGGARAHPCRWESCRAVFASSDALTTHITEEHVGGGKPRYECFWAGCPRNGERGFISKQKICRHMQSHTGHRPFQCKVCAEFFSEAATLQQHMRRHTREKPYICDYPNCGKAFAIAGALTIHKRTHNGVKPFKCTYCDRAFAESSNLAKHLRTHTGVRLHICPHEGCGKQFARTDQLNRHMGVHGKNRLSLLVPQ